MIPTAQVLSDILNDPAIPAEAKPKDMEAHPRKQRGEIVGYDFVVALGWRPFAGEEFMVNAALYYSLSEWLWERGMHVRAGVMIEARAAASDEWCWTEGCTFIDKVAATPLEALAAVVREVATASVPAAPPASADTPGSPPGA